MEERIYSSTTLEKCLELASLDLAVSQDKINYKILQEKKGLFKKNVTIQVTVQDTKEEPVNSSLSLKDGTIMVKDETIIVKNPEEGGRAATIVPSDSLLIKINGEEITNKTEVFQESNIEVIYPELKAKRTLNVKTSQDKMEAFVSTEYVAETTFKLRDIEETNSAVLYYEPKEEKYPSVYTLDEIKKELRDCGIVFGIIEENLKKLSEERNIFNLLVAKGIEPIDDEEDTLKLQFQTSHEVKFQEDKKGRVDYRNFKSIEAVSANTLIAEKISGKQGKDGTNIRGEAQRRKIAKPINFRTGEGCEIREGNKVYSLIEGKPSMKNGVIIVSPVYELNADVDLKTGNIKFLGEVVINGNVKEGMKIEAGGAIIIEKSIESCEVIGKGDITIRGNVLLSRVFGGGEDVFKIKHHNNLQSLKKTLETMMETIVEIKRFNLLGEKSKDGEIIKALIENKFKIIPKICANIIRDNLTNPVEEENEIMLAIKEKLLGLAPLNIKHFSEIEHIISIVSRRMDIIKNNLSIPVDVNISYCQDSTIQSSGNINFIGKGMYISNVISNSGIYFQNETAIARGGTLKAKEILKCSTVGSSGGVSTRLMVSNKGHIYANVAYQNTILCLGEREFVIEAPSKNVHAYIDDYGELIVDKLLL